MRRVLGFLFVLAGASFAAASGAQTTAAKPANAAPPKAGSSPAPAKAVTVTIVHTTIKLKTVTLAPADEYFGPLKMSVLGIRNEIHDLAIRYDVKADGDHALAKQIMGTALMTEASVADWEKKYPADDQLARDVYLLQHLYAKIDFDSARSKAKYCAQWLFTRYPKSWYAKNLHMTMAREGGPAKETQPAGAPSTTSPNAPVSPASTETSGQPAGSPAAPQTNQPAPAPQAAPMPAPAAPAGPQSLIPQPVTPSTPGAPVPAQSSAPVPAPAPSST